MLNEINNNRKNMDNEQINNIDTAPQEIIQKNKNINVNETYIKDEKSSEISITDITSENKTKEKSESEFNLLQIKKELDEYKRNKILKRNSIKPLEIIEEEFSEEKKQKNVEQIIQQWLSLQKTIKEEITLEDVIIHQQSNDTNNLKNFFKSYYETKLKTRKNYEDINELNIGNKDYLSLPSFYIQDEVEKTLRDASDPIKNLLFILRNNYDYLMRVLSLINRDDLIDNRKKVNSIVELLNNQFYENILIPNPEQQELLILINYLKKKLYL